MPRPIGVPLSHLTGWRRFRNFSQSDLAEKTKISQQAIAGIENGQHGASSDVVERLANMLGVTAAQLMFEAAPGEGLADGPRVRGVALPYLQDWMTYRGMLPRALAIEAKMGVSTIYNVLRTGKADIRTTKKLADALGIHPFTLENTHPRKQNMPDEPKVT